MRAATLIEKKRDGFALSELELRFLVGGYAQGLIPDYQMAAFAMAVMFQGLSDEETMEMTRLMMHSGEVFTYPAGSPPKVDKHSTGGIGDKVSLVLAPLLACTDTVWVPMISGRGLGITGGTLDKLESIPGFRVDLDMRASLAQLDDIGVFMMGQSPTICPADKRLYALRDVTGTVPSRHLIIPSILSKKLAENLDRLVLDVKFGSGAFMKTEADARDLAEGLLRVANGMGVETHVRYSPMDVPLGLNVGNALEVAEAVDCLQGAGPSDLRELTLRLAACVVPMGEDELGKLLDNGQAWARFVKMVEAQHGDAACLERILEVHAAPVIQRLVAASSGTLTKLDAGVLGETCVTLGAGRAKTTDKINPAVGLRILCKPGSQIAAGDPILEIHAASDGAAEKALTVLESAIQIE